MRNNPGVAIRTLLQAKELVVGIKQRQADEMLNLLLRIAEDAIDVAMYRLEDLANMPEPDVTIGGYELKD